MRSVMVFFLSVLLCVLSSCVSPPARGVRNGIPYERGPDGVYERVVPSDVHTLPDVKPIVIDRNEEKQGKNSSTCADFWILARQCRESVSHIRKFSERQNYYRNCIIENDKNNMSKMCTKI